MIRTTIKSRMMAYYMLLLVISLLASGVLYQRINQNLAEEKISEASIQTLFAIQSGLQSIFENTNKYSQRMIASETIQNILRTTWKDEGIVESNRQVQNVLSEIILAEPTITSVYVFREDGIYYTLDNEGLKPAVGQIRQASWYQEALRRNGALIWRMNGGGIFEPHPKGERYLSLIRTVNDLHTAKPIGILVVNVPLPQIQQSYERALSQNAMELMVERKDAALIPFAHQELRDYIDAHQLWGESPGSVTVKLSGKRYLITTLEAEGWQYAAALPAAEWTNPYGPVNKVLLPMALFIFAFLFLGSLWISKAITDPLLRLLKSMRRVEAGEYHPVQVSQGSDEIRQLQDRYNSMIGTIQASLQREKEEQRTRRILELEILQQQIRPHFLYNALEAAGYLSLTGEGKEAYRLITSLSQFYRLSLSKGSEVIPLSEEMELTRHYLTIQEMRYPGLFKVTYELEAEASGTPIPKLSLQPLVENALYHGIRPTGQEGKIRITARITGDFIRLTVEDDGIGMTEEQTLSVMKERLAANGASFGLRGTIMRLQLYYGDKFNYAVESSRYHGTSVTITIPLKEELTWRVNSSQPSSSMMN